jgi:hypothetical protein
MPSSSTPLSTTARRLQSRGGHAFIQLLVVLLTLQGVPLQELSRHSRWHSPVSLAWVRALPVSVVTGVETLQTVAAQWLGQPSA